MKRLLWLTVMVLGMTACGGATTAITTPTTTAPSTTANTTGSPAFQAAGTDLSGLGFEVHKAPG